MEVDNQRSGSYSIEQVLQRLIKDDQIRGICVRLKLQCLDGCVASSWYGTPKALENRYKNTRVTLSVESNTVHYKDNHNLRNSNFKLVGCDIASRIATS